MHVHVYTERVEHRKAITEGNNFFNCTDRCAQINTRRNKNFTWSVWKIFQMFLASPLPLHTIDLVSFSAALPRILATDSPTQTCLYAQRAQADVQLPSHNNFLSVSKSQWWITYWLVIPRFSPSIGIAAWLSINWLQIRSICFVIFKGVLSFTESV